MMPQWQYLRFILSRQNSISTVGDSNTVWFISGAVSHFYCLLGMTLFRT